MKLATLTTALVVLSAGYALAQGTPNTMSSGRPSAVLNDDQCKSVWTMASPNGDALSQDKAVPYVVNFHMVDTGNDGTISADEFKAACGKGLIQGSDASMMKDMKPAGGNMKPGQEYRLISILDSRCRLWPDPSWQAGKTIRRRLRSAPFGTL